MDEKQYKDLVEKIGKEAADKIKSEFAELEKKQGEAIANATKGLATEEAVKEATKAVEEKAAKLEEILKVQGIAINELKQGGSENAKQTLVQVVEKEMEGLKASTKKGKDHEFVIKADTLRAAIGDNAAALDVPGIGQLATRKLSVYDLFRKVPVPKDRNGVIRYVDWDADTTVRAAAAIAENGSFPSSTAKWQTYTLSLEKVGDSIPMSEEFLYDAALFAAELKNFLDVNIALKVDTDLISANGSSPNIKGILAQIDAYTAAASGIADASIYDLIVKLREAISKPYGSKYNPNVILMNISDINAMKLKKDANNTYILPPFYDKNGNVVDGISVVECNAITANQAVVGDSRYGAIYEEPGVTVTTGFATGDFESDMMTIKARRRLNLLIRNCDKTGWLKVTDIADALTTLAS